MKSKSLLGAIIGDILHNTFSDKKFVYDPDSDKPILSEKSRISGYTVITLAVAKYIMEYYHLYEGRIEPGRSEKRKELLCKTILALAKAHPELDYPEWLKKWMSSDKYIPTKDNDGMTVICFSPLINYFSRTTDLESTLRMVSEAIPTVICSKSDDNGYKIYATALYGCTRYDISVVHDFLASLYNFRWPKKLKELESKYGWNTSVSKAMEPALTIFYLGDNEFMMNTPITNIERGISDINRIGGLSSLVTPLISTLVYTSHSGWLFNKVPFFDEMESMRALIPDDLLEINDDFLDFMGNGHDDELDDDNNDNEPINGIEPDEDGTIPFGDLLKLL